MRARATRLGAARFGGRRLVPAFEAAFVDGFVDSRITFTRASAGFRTNASGNLESLASDVPRIDYDPVTLACRGLLIEEQRTNLLLNSATLSTQNVTTSATPYTLSFYGTGTVTLSGTSTAGPLVGTGAYPNRVTLTFTPTAGTLTLTVTGSVTSAQLEAGSFATSYITTTGASAVRAADVAVISGANFSGFYNAAAGTIAIEATFMAPAASYVTAPVLGGVGAGGFGEDIYFPRSTSGDITSDVVDGGVSQASLTIANVTGASTVKVAISYEANNLVACGNGGTVQTDASATLPTVASLSIGKATWSSGNTANAWIRRVRYFNRTSTGAELVALTA